MRSDTAPLDVPIKTEVGDDVTLLHEGTEVGDDVTLLHEGTEVGDDVTLLH